MGAGPVKLVESAAKLFSRPGSVERELAKHVGGGGGGLKEIEDRYSGVEGEAEMLTERERESRYERAGERERARDGVQRSVSNLPCGTVA